MAFATLSDYELIHGTVGNAAQVERQLDRATAMIQSLCRQTLIRTTDTIRIQGTWERELLLPERPVVSVDKVVVNDVEVEGFEVTTRGVIWSTGARFVGGASPVFPPSWGGHEGLVDVTYTYGFDPIPDDLRDLCVDIAGVAMSTPVGVRRESTQIEDYSESTTYTDTADGPLMSAVIRKYSW